MFINKLEQQSLQQIEANRTLTSTLKALVSQGSTTTSFSLETTVQLVCARNFRVISKVRKQAWAALDLEQPVLSIEEEADVTGLTVE